MSQIHIFGGGTISHVRSHLALCAPAYGGTARKLVEELTRRGLGAQVSLELTRMAEHTSDLETNDDVARRVARLLNDPNVKAIVFNVALCDFEGQIGCTPSGKYAFRLKSRDGSGVTMRLKPAAKVLATIKAARPDIYLVGFKTTTGDGVDQQVGLARRQIAETGADLVVANDTGTRVNIS